MAERQVGGAQNREANLGKEKLAKRITMVSKSPKDRSPSKWTKLNGLEMEVPNHLVTGMILQVVVLIVISQSCAAWMIIFLILNGPSKGSQLTVGGGSHQPVQGNHCSQVAKDLRYL